GTQTICARGSRSHARRSIRAPQRNGSTALYGSPETACPHETCRVDSFLRCTSSRTTYGWGKLVRFADALRDGFGAVAEFKRRSPSAGDLRPDGDPAEIGRAYETAGARAMSVLVDERFAGSWD